MAVALELFLIRHGLAEERGDAWPDDAKRPLTGDGMARLRKASRGLEAIGVAVDVVLTSPFVRARQTADIVAAGLSSRPPVVPVDSLAPGGSYAAIVADLERQTRKARVALVGHEPGLGALAARLIGSRHPIDFKKGAVCRIDLDEVPRLARATCAGCSRRRFSDACGSRAIRVARAPSRANGARLKVRATRTWQSASGPEPVRLPVLDRFLDGFL